MLVEQPLASPGSTKNYASQDNFIQRLVVMVETFKRSGHQKPHQPLPILSKNLQIRHLGFEELHSSLSNLKKPDSLNKNIYIYMYLPES